MPSQARQPLRVLFVGGTEEGAQLLTRELARGRYDVGVTRVTDAAALKARLAAPSASWNVVLADASSDAMAGDGLANLCRISGDVPVVAVRRDPISGARLDDTAGASEAEGPRLLRAIERALLDTLLRAERQELRDQLARAEHAASLGFLTAGVAHEINNPLASVIANLEFVHGEVLRFQQAGVDVGEAMGALRDASDGATVIREVVRDMRTFAQQDARDPNAILDVRPVVERAIRMTWHELRFRARLVRDFRPTPRVRANDARLTQVFLNLIINATHAIPAGHVEDNEVRVVTRTDERGSCVVEVHDTGSGIPPEHLHHIFDAYFTTKAPGEGTGLGLAVSQRILRQLGGEIFAESGVGGGACFRVVLPAAPSGGGGAGGPR